MSEQDDNVEHAWLSKKSLYVKVQCTECQAFWCASVWICYWTKDEHTMFDLWAPSTRITVSLVLRDQTFSLFWDFYIFETFRSHCTVVYAWLFAENTQNPSQSSLLGTKDSHQTRPFAFNMFSDKDRSDIKEVGRSGGNLISSEQPVLIPQNRKLGRISSVFAENHEFKSDEQLLTIWHITHSKNRSYWK